MRQVHHWTAVIFVAVIVAHLARVFFTGAFRRPRELNWLLGFGLRCSRSGRAFTGYSLPDDLLSGTGPAHRVLGDALDPVRRAVRWLAGLRRRVPDADVHHPLLRPPRDAAAGAVRRRRSRAHVGARVPPEAHPVPRPAAARGQRRRPPLLAGAGVPVGRPVLPDRRGRGAASGGLVQINPVWAYGPFEPSRSCVARAARLVRRAGSTGRCGSSRRSSP